MTEYRDVRVQPGRPVAAVAVVPAGGLPRVTYRRVSPFRFEVHVTAARRPFLLATAETYASGWRVTAEHRPPMSLRHLRVDGYANGWQIPWRGTYDLTITYRPEALARAARKLDLIVLPLALLVPIGRRIARRRRRREAA